MTDDHTILLVEDDPVLADELGALLRDCGYRIVHAATFEAARRALLEGGLCAAILDIALPLDGRSSPRVEVGYTFLNQCRDMYPSTWGKTQHRGFQIIVYSGNARDAASIKKVFPQADVVIEKGAPKSGSLGADLLETLKTCLERSGRASHADCAKVERACRVTASGSAGPVLQLHVTSRTRGDSTCVEVDGEPVWIPQRAFTVLRRLAVERMKEDGEGWVTVTKPPYVVPGMTKEVSEKALSENRKLLAPAIEKSLERQRRGSELKVFENHRDGKFRINPLISVSVDQQWLEADAATPGHPKRKDRSSGNRQDGVS